MPPFVVGLSLRYPKLNITPMRSGERVAAGAGGDLGWPDGYLYLLKRVLREPFWAGIDRRVN
jgi:hypothetical protein